MTELQYMRENADGKKYSATEIAETERSIVKIQRMLDEIEADTPRRGPEWCFVDVARFILQGKLDYMKENEE